MAIIAAEETMYFSNTQLHLPTDAVERLAATLNAINGVHAHTANAGRDLKITITANTAAKLESLKSIKVVPAIKHAIAKSQRVEDATHQAVLAYLKS